MNNLKVVFPFFLLVVSCSTYRVSEVPESSGMPDIPDVYDAVFPESGASGGRVLSFKYDLPAVPGYSNTEILSPAVSPSPDVFLWKDSVSDHYAGMEGTVLLDLPVLPKRVGAHVPGAVPDAVSAADRRAAPPAPPASRKISVAEKPADNVQRTVSRKQVEYETVVSPIGENSIVTVSLNGTGWLFLGAEGSSAGISFSSRLNRQGVTEFHFKVGAPGTFRLKFQQQDPLSGRIAVRGIQLKAVEMPSDTPSRNQEKNASEAPEKVESLESLIDGGRYGEAFGMYDHVEVLSEVLRRGVADKDTKALEFFYDKAVSGDGSYSLFFTDSRYINMTVNAGKLLVKKGRAAEGVSLLEKIVSEAHDLRKMDEILYILGYSFQNTGSIRDERKAAGYYKRIIDEYPASIYWDSAKREYLVIKRMYIDVR